MAVTESPQRGVGRGRQDPRIADLDATLTKEQRHAMIVKKCNLTDELYAHVYVLDKSINKQPKNQCRACNKVFEGGPHRIMIHNLDEMKGLTTCKPCEVVDAHGAVLEVPTRAVMEQRKKAHEMCRDRYDKLVRRPRRRRPRRPRGLRRRALTMTRPSIPSI